MSLNGALHIQLTLAKQDNQFHISEIAINLARPNIAQRILVGQSPQQAITRITQLMTVCQHAQTAAAKLALGYPLTDEEILAIEYENIEQGFWRLVIDLPRLLDVELPLSIFIELRQAITKQNSEKIKLYAEQLFQQLCHLTPNEFYNLSNSTLQDWLNESDSVMACCLRQVALIMPAGVDNNDKNSKAAWLAPIPDDELLTTLGKLIQSEHDFYQKPHLNKKSCETGSLSIMQNHPLFALLSTLGSVGRFVSRLLYIAQKINGLSGRKSKNKITGSFARRPSEDTDEKGYNLGWVQTARGLLIHLANIQQGEISQYFIVAPTEWSFHPEGSLSNTLIHSRFSSPQFAEKAVKLAIVALDPCIEFNLGVAYA